MGDHRPVQAALLDQIDPAQVGVRVAQPGPADQPLDLDVVERGVGVIDDELDTFGERHAQSERIVVGLEGLDQRRSAHLAELAFGLRIDDRHRGPPA